VNAASRALDLLEALLDDRRPLTPAELGRRLDIPRSTLHELVHTLADRGYLRATPDGYTLGVRLFELGGAFRTRLDVAAIGQEAARELVAACQETSQVAVLDGSEVVYIAKVDGTHPVRLVSEVGRRLPASCTALGKALLSGLSERALDTLYPSGGPLPTMTRDSIADLDQLKRALGEVRRTGVAFDDCESNEAVRCIAAPVRDAAGDVVAAISVSAPTIRWSDAQRARLVELVVDAAARVSQQLAAPAQATDVGARSDLPTNEPGPRGRRHVSKL
jgi:DNA-binding IclR family transcriptional regulator